MKNVYSKVFINPNLERKKNHDFRYKRVYYLTCERFFSRVRVLVPDEHGFVDEAFLAHRTVVWSLTRLRMSLFLVGGQAGGHGKVFPANITDVWPLTGMQSHVALKNQ